LDRSLDTPRDLERLVVKRCAEATAEASTHEGDVDVNVVLVDAEESGGGLLGPSAGLGRGPYLAAAMSSLIVMFMGSMVAWARKGNS
jgi:hypothetical protein